MPEPDTTAAPPNNDTKSTYVRHTQELVPIAAYDKEFKEFINSKPGLKIFYGSTKLDEKVNKAKVMGDALMGEGCGGEFALKLSLLTLYDIVMLIDDSTSMDYSEGGARKDTLKRTLEEITKVYDLANETGILSVRFINNRKGKRNVKNSKVGSVFLDRKYKGSTMIGTALEKKILEEFVWKRKMEKPLLVMTVTDGTIEGEKSGKLKHVIKKCIEALKLDDSRGDGSVAFHFCRVGNDKGAMEMLEHLDDCKEVGEYVDCLSVDSPLEELEDDGLKWRILTKLLIGALDPKIDEMDMGLGSEVIDSIDLSVRIEKDEDDYTDED